MRLHSTLLLAVVVSTGFACSSSGDAASPDAPPMNQAADVTGIWQTDRVLIETYPGSRQTTLSFDDHGAMTMDAREFGVFPGEGTDDVSSLSHTSASYSVSGDSLRMKPSQIRWFNHVEGPNSPEHVLDVTPPSLDETLQFKISGDQLTLRVISPKEATFTILYHRVR
jgi:hypothetical protein